MPKGGTIPPAERRSWLERYEQGASIDTIAKGAGRTQRTVTAQLARARQERQHELVQVDLIRDAYREHYRDLLEAAEGLAERCDTPNSRGVLPEPGLEPDARMLYEGLYSHIPGSRLWKGVKTWEEASRGLAEEWERARFQVAMLIQQLVAGFPQVLEDGFVESLRDAVMTAAQGRDPWLLEYQRHSSGDFMQLRRGNCVLADRVQTDARLGEIEAKHREILGDSLEVGSASWLKSLWNRWSEARDIIHEEVRTLRLRRVLTGQCHLCPGGDASSARRPRRRRRNG